MSYIAEKKVANCLVIVQIVAMFVREVHMENVGLLEQNIKDPDYSVQVYALPVGQGDCTIIQCPGNAKKGGEIIIFDCGASGGEGFSATGVKNFLGEKIHKVKYIIISHGDMDHVKFLPDIFPNKFKPWQNIISVYYGGKLSDYPAIRDWMEEWKRVSKLSSINNEEPFIQIGDSYHEYTLQCSQSYKYGSTATIDVLAANIGPTKNEESIVMKITHGNWSMLQPGDMEGSASKKIATTLGTKLKSVVNKMSHHGASTMANLNEWLEPIKPQYAFVSSAYQYGNCRHPRCAAIIRLLSFGTIKSTKSYDFYCSDSKRNAVFMDISHSILQTTIDKNYVCILQYSSSFASPVEDCTKITNDEAEDEPEPDDDCLPSDPVCTTDSCGNTAELNIIEG